jgi:hypothetical protein
MRCHDATVSPFVAKVRCEVFAHFYTLAVKRRSSLRNWLFGQPGRILYEEFNLSRRKWWTCSWLCSSPVSHFLYRWVWTFHVQLMLSSPNACLIIPRLSVPLFPRFFLDAVPLKGQSPNHIRPYTRFQTKGRKHQDFYPAVWHFIHWLLRCASTIIYSCIALLQLLYRWQR